MKIPEIFFQILGAFGGAGVIILALARWLGKIWAGKILEKDRAKYNNEIEKLKNELRENLESYKCQIELAKLALARYSEHQFDLYNQLWFALTELKIAGELLWAKTDIDNLLEFANKLWKTRESVEKHVLLIEDQHYTQLNQLLEHFSNYMVGKYRLIDLWNNKKPIPDLGEALLQSDIIKNNNLAKQRYEELLILIRCSFKEQLKR